MFPVTWLLKPKGPKGLYTNHPPPESVRFGNGGLFPKSVRFGNGGTKAPTMGRRGLGLMVKGGVRARRAYELVPVSCAILEAGPITDYELRTEFIKEVSPLLPNLCHHQDYDRSIFPRSAWFRRMPPEDVRR